MRRFSEFGIKTDRSFVGDKIKISRVLNQEILVLEFKVEQSKYPKNKTGKCLWLQIEIEGERRVVFTGSDVLIGQINQVDRQNIPFLTRIIKEGDSFLFT